MANSVPAALEKSLLRSSILLAGARFLPSCEVTEFGSAITFQFKVKRQTAEILGEVARSQRGEPNRLLSSIPASQIRVWS